MAAVSEIIVREFLEAHSFFVRHPRKHVAPGHRDEEDIDFVAFNPHFLPRSEPLPFVLTAEELPHVARAVVSVRAWHTEIFTAALLGKTPELVRFAAPAAYGAVARLLPGDGPVLKLLVVPALPQGAAARQQSTEFLRARGVDALFEFRTVLADLVERVEGQRNYQRSDVLQVIRLLKHYNLLRDPQLELFKARRRRTRAR